MTAIIVLLVLGLCFGSFVNALVWRLHAKLEGGLPGGKGKSKIKNKDLSMLKGRSMCVHCGHQLAARDLVPIVSWLLLKGRCRYCREPIAWQYPAVEVSTAILFVLSYVAWPYGFDGVGWGRFAIWLVLLTGFMALVVYDLRWMLLPNRIVYPLIGLACLQICLVLISGRDVLGTVTGAVMGLAACGGLFYVIFQISGGRWIGGGDVKLGFLLGLLVADPVRSLMVLLLASGMGTLVILPLLLSRRLDRSSRIPFGPFLITAGIILYLFGNSLIGWYMQKFLVAL